MTFELRLEQLLEQTKKRRRYSKVRCARCTGPVQLTPAEVRELRSQGEQPLCDRCDDREVMRANRQGGKARRAGSYALVDPRTGRRVWQRSAGTRKGARAQRKRVDQVIAQLGGKKRAESHPGWKRGAVPRGHHWQGRPTCWERTFKGHLVRVCGGGLYYEYTVFEGRRGTDWLYAGTTNSFENAARMAREDLEAVR